MLLIMARPIKETPILYGEDARRFVEEMRKVDSLSYEERLENTRKLRERVANAPIKIEFRAPWKSTK